MINFSQQPKHSKILVDVKDRIFWTKKEASAMCGVSPKIFSDLVREGKMPQPFHGRLYSAHDVWQASKKYNIKPQETSKAAYEAWSAVNG